MTELRNPEADGKVQGLPEIRRSLPIALLRAREKVMLPIRVMLQDIGLTEQQWRVLRVLEEEGALDSSTLAERSALLLPSLTRIMQALEERGLIERSADPADRRRLHVVITPLGRACLTENAIKSARISEEIRTQFGEEKLENLLTLLDELQDIDLLQR